MKYSDWEKSILRFKRNVGFWGPLNQNHKVKLNLLFVLLVFFVKSQKGDFVFMFWNFLPNVIVSEWTV